MGKVMNDFIDREIRYNTEGEYKSLYEWCLNEYSKDGKKIGSDLIPWPWTLYFTAMNLRYSKTLEGSSNPEEVDKSIKESERIFAELHPGGYKGGIFKKEASLSMFGTDRAIENITLIITPSENDMPEGSCYLFGSVSYEMEIDFVNEIEPDFLQVDITLSLSKFRELRELVCSNQITNAELSIKNVSGFYSEWSPSITARHIKVLATQSVVMPEGVDIELPKLNVVGGFNINFIHHTTLKTKQELSAVADDDTFEDSPLDSVKVETKSDSMTQERLINIEQSLEKLKTPLWILVAILAILVFK